MSSGPKGHKISIPFYVGGRRVCTFDRSSMKKREGFDDQKIHNSCGGRLNSRPRCGCCKKMLETEMVPDPGAIMPESSNASPEEVEQIKAKKVELRANLDVMERSLATASAQIPKKLVCAHCGSNLEPESKIEPFCLKCDDFELSPALGYAREDGTDLVLTEEQYTKLDSLRMDRSLHYIGLLPSNFVFPEWQVESCFALEPRGKGILAGAFRQALFQLDRGMLVRYCSANEEARITLKNEWVGVVRATNDGKSLTLVTLNARADVCATEDEPAGDTPVSMKMVQLLMSKMLTGGQIESMTLRTPARDYLADLLSNPKGRTTVVGEVGSTDFDKLVDELLEAAKQQEQDTQENAD